MECMEQLPKGMASHLFVFLRLYLCRCELMRCNHGSETMQSRLTTASAILARLRVLHYSTLIRTKNLGTGSITCCHENYLSSCYASMSQYNTPSPKIDRCCLSTPTLGSLPSLCRCSNPSAAPSSRHPTPAPVGILGFRLTIWNVPYH